MTAKGTTPAPNVYARVWDIYDEYRTSLFHEKYFERKLSGLQSRALYLDIVIAVGTSTTGIAGWALWNRPAFAPIWAVFAGIAATLAIVKPVLRWDDEAKTCAELFGQHSRMSAAYDRLVSDIAYRQGLDGDILARHADIVKLTAMVKRVPQTPISLLKEIQGEVNRLKPPDRFWQPPKPADAQAPGYQYGG